jgi:hypothetical protein
MTRCKLLSAVLLAPLAAVPAHAVVGVHMDFTSYNAAVGGVHTYYLDFEHDRFGNPTANSVGDFNGDFFDDVSGAIFSTNITYISSGFPNDRVNTAFIDNHIRTEIGPVGDWGGVLRMQYNGGQRMRATAFEGVEIQAGDTFRLFDGESMVGEITVPTSTFYQFYGLVSSVPFDRVDISGVHFAIGDHYSTAVPAPAAAGVLLGGIGLVARRRRR